MAQVTAQVTFSFGSMPGDKDGELIAHAIRLLQEVLERNQPEAITILRINQH